MRLAATIQHSTFKSQHCAPRLRVQKNIRVIRVIRVQKIQCEIRVPPKKYIRVIPKALLDFFMGFFDMIVAGRRDYALMTEALLVKPV